MVRQEKKRAQTDSNRSMPVQNDYRRKTVVRRLSLHKQKHKSWQDEPGESAMSASTLTITRWFNPVFGWEPNKTGNSLF